MVQDKDFRVQPEPVCIFSYFCQYRATVRLLQLKVPCKIPQKSHRGLASWRSFRQKTKGNANKAGECVFTPSESQKCPKMFKNVQNVLCGAQILIQVQVALINLCPRPFLTSPLDFPPSYQSRGRWKADQLTFCDFWKILYVYIWKISYV